MNKILTFIFSIFFAISVSAQQSPESVVRDYVRLLNDWLASPYDMQKKEKIYAILQNGKEKCTIKDEIVEKYNSDAGVSRCIYDVYFAILRNIDVKKVEIMGMKNTSNDFIKRATVILKLSGGIDLTTVSDFWISAQSISYIVSNDEEIMRLRTQKNAIIYIDDVNPKQDQSTSQPISSSDGHNYVDLGLPSGTLWATCNIGAKKPWNYGDYFAWGETVSKMNYEMKTYKHTTHYKRTTITYLTKYCTQSDYGIIVDNITKLNYEDDAATIKWGKNWCMPTYEQIKELQDNCSWRFKTIIHWACFGLHRFIIIHQCMLGLSACHSTMWTYMVRNAVPDVPFDLFANITINILQHRHFFTKEMLPNRTPNLKKNLV